MVITGVCEGRKRNSSGLSNSTLCPLFSLFFFFSKISFIFFKIFAMKLKPGGKKSGGFKFNIWLIGGFQFLVVNLSRVCVVCVCVETC